MTDPAPVPWPGVEPPPFEFPFAEAASARTTLEELQQELTDMTTLHNDSYAGLSDLNQGETIRLFRLGHDARMEGLGVCGVKVADAILALDDLVAQARAAEQQRNDAHGLWVVRDAAYREAVANGDPVVGRFDNNRYRSIPI